MGTGLRQDDLLTAYRRILEAAKLDSVVMTHLSMAGQTLHTHFGITNYVLQEPAVGSDDRQGIIKPVHSRHRSDYFKHSCTFVTDNLAGHPR